MKIYTMCYRCRKMITIDNDCKIDVIVPGRTKGLNLEDIELDDEIVLCPNCKLQFEKWLDLRGDSCVSDKVCD